jgi:hypothetical protein
MLTDDSNDPRQIPTRQNMLDAMRWLVRSARTDDSLFFHCMSNFTASGIAIDPLPRSLQTLGMGDRRQTLTEMK